MRALDNRRCGFPKNHQQNPVGPWLEGWGFLHTLLGPSLLLSAGHVAGVVWDFFIPQ